MDERLERALEQANYVITIQSQKKNIQLRFENAMSYSVNGGTFIISQELIAFVNCMMAQHTDAILIDVRGNPILIEDLGSFYDQIMQRYTEATQEFYTEYTALRKARTTKAAVA
jgi:hypothetical protein